MKAATDLTARLESSTSVTPQDLQALAKLRDPLGNAVSFYFSHTTTASKAHREELIAIRGLIQEKVNGLPAGSASAPLSHDLADLLALAEEIRLTPNRLHIVFADRSMHVWQQLDLPVISPQSSLYLDRRFHLAPLMRAVQSMTPYSVVLLESGKARVFVVRGTEIHEVPEQASNEDLSLHAEDSRVGWSKHIEGGQRELEKTYFKELLQQLQQFLSKQRIGRLVIGCREDLWGEIEPQFAALEKSVLIGRFHLPSFAASAAEILQIARPLFEASQRTRVDTLLQEISETPSRGSYGVEQVLQILAEAGAQKVVLGMQSAQSIHECSACGHMMPDSVQACAFCGSSDLLDIPAEEGIIRQALLSGAEILFAETSAHEGFKDVAALLRHG